MGVDVNGKVAAFCKLARDHAADAVQVWRGQVGGVPRLDDLIAAQPIDANLSPDKLTASILEEAEECSGRVRFTIKSVRAGNEVARDRLVLDGGHPAEIERNTVTRSLVTAPNGVGPARPIEGVLEGVVDADAKGIEFAQRSNAAIASALLRDQMKQNTQLVGLVIDLTTRSHAPLLKQTETLAAALDVAHKKLIEGAEQHVEQVRQSRVLEAEARTEERKGIALEKTGEMLAKYLPAVLARISRKYGIVAEDDENDPLLEKLVTSFKPEQFAKMQAILNPEQVALFADVWASMDGRKQARESKKNGKKNGASSGAKKLPKDAGAAASSDAAEGGAVAAAAAAIESAFGGLVLTGGAK